jgi:hypothetical protein
MNSSKKTARIVGVLFIIATLAPILTAPFIGFLGGGVIGDTTPDYLVNVSANEPQVLIALLIELVWVLAVVGIPIVLFPILKKYNEALALGFYSLRFIEAISTVVSSIGLLALLALSQEFAKAGAPDASYYQTLGASLLAAREGAFMIGSGLVWSLSALVLNYILYQSKLIPRWLSGWGLVGVRIPMKSSTSSGHAVHLSERSDASMIIIPSSGRHGQGRIDLAP